MKIILKPLGALCLMGGVGLLLGIVIVDRANPKRDILVSSQNRSGATPSKDAETNPRTSAGVPIAVSAPNDPKGILPTADQNQVEWNYTTDDPGPDWMKPGYRISDVSDLWKVGAAGFGNDQQGVIGTAWKTPDIWMRRQITLPAKWRGQRALRVFHDEEAEIYINGILAAKITEYSPTYAPVEISDAAYDSLKPGKKNLIAVHCHNAVGGQFIDVGF